MEIFIDGKTCSGEEGQTVLDRLIPSRNMLYAIRIDGEFEHVKCRAAPKSENYMPLVEATKDQPVFEFHNISGSLAGFYTPSFMESLNAPGYHVHFLSEDLLRGGHVMQCSLKKVHIGIQHIPRLDVGLPVTLDYLTTDLSRDVGKDLDKAEKQSLSTYDHYKNVIQDSEDGLTDRGAVGPLKA